MEVTKGPGDGGVEEERRENRKAITMREHAGVLYYLICVFFSILIF